MEDNLKDLYMKIIKYPLDSKEYKECLSQIRNLEIGEHTLGLDISLNPVSPRYLGIAESSYSKVY